MPRPKRSAAWGAARGRLARVALLLGRLQRAGRLPLARTLACESGLSRRTIHRLIAGLRLILRARGERLVYRPRDWCYVFRGPRRRGARHVDATRHRE